MIIPIADSLVFPLLLAVHFVADFLLQNAWLSEYKVSLRYPAAWIHGGCHLVGLVLFVSWPIALALALSYVLLDTRKPLRLWRNLVRQTTDSAKGAGFAMWQDQAVHIILLVIATVVVL